MAEVKITTHVNYSGDVVLKWEDPQDSNHKGSLTLPAQTALALGRNLVMNSAKAYNIKDLFNQIDQVFTQVKTNEEDKVK